MGKLCITLILCAIVAFAQGQKYKFIRMGTPEKPAKASFLAAFKMCLDDNKLLLTPDTLPKLRELQKYLETEEIPFTWIALTDLMARHNFGWLSTGQILLDAIWHPAQPNNEYNNERCVEMVYRMHKIRMNDMRCDMENYVFCETSTPEIIKHATERYLELTQIAPVS